MSCLSLINSQEFFYKLNTNSLLVSMVQLFSYNLWLVFLLSFEGKKCFLF